MPPCVNSRSGGEVLVVFPRDGIIDSSSSRSVDQKSHSCTQSSYAGPMLLEMESMSLVEQGEKQQQQVLPQHHHHHHHHDSAAASCCGSSVTSKTSVMSCDDNDHSSSTLGSSQRRRYCHSSSSLDTGSYADVGIRKRVSFPSSIKTLAIVYETIHVSDYSVEERYATWYNYRDLKSFKKDRRHTARRADQGLLEEDDCLRGVENATEDGSRIRYNHIVDGINSVLNEQDLQDQDGKWNPDALAYIYSVVSQDSVHEAQQRALEDQRDLIVDTDNVSRSKSLEDSDNTDTMVDDMQTIYL